ncbi:MAG: hypothetical protein KGJ93_02085 [Patescibacteria group bacterium]|nr:hypothetical protein [Patescibacteria group bacterium]
MPFKQLSASLKNFHGQKVRPQYLFLLVLLIVLALDIMVIKNSVGVVLGWGSVPPPLPTKTSGIRVDFQDYQDILTSMQQAQNFQPTASVSKNPFGIVGQ